MMRVDDPLPHAVVATAYPHMLHTGSLEVYRRTMACDVQAGTNGPMGGQIAIEHFLQMSVPLEHLADGTRILPCPVGRLNILVHDGALQQGGDACKQPEGHEQRQIANRGNIAKLATLLTDHTIHERWVADGEAPAMLHALCAATRC